MTLARDRGHMTFGPRHAIAHSAVSRTGRADKMKKLSVAQLDALWFAVCEGTPVGPGCQRPTWSRSKLTTTKATCESLVRMGFLTRSVREGWEGWEGWYTLTDIGSIMGNIHRTLHCKASVDPARYLNRGVS